MGRRSRHIEAVHVAACDEFLVATLDGEIVAMGALRHVEIRWARSNGCVPRQLTSEVGSLARC
jgi:hypothetical protein